MKKKKIYTNSTCLYMCNLSQKIVIYNHRSPKKKSRSKEFILKKEIKCNIKAHIFFGENFCIPAEQVISFFWYIYTREANTVANSACPFIPVTQLYRV